MELVALEGLSPGTAYPLGSTRLTFGRSAGCSVVLDDDEVSREHCHVLPTSDGYVIEDLGSRNGTIVDGELIERPTPLRSGSLVVVGRTLFEVRGAAPSGVDVQPVRVDAPPPGPAATAREAVLAGRLLQQQLASVLPVVERAAGEAEARWVLALCRAVASDPDPERRMEILRSTVPAIQQTVRAAFDVLGLLPRQS